MLKKYWLCYKWKTLYEEALRAYAERMGDVIYLFANQHMYLVSKTDPQDIPEIVYNISPRAVTRLNISLEGIKFVGTFKGKHKAVKINLEDVKDIFLEEGLLNKIIRS